MVNTNTRKNDAIDDGRESQHTEHNKAGRQPVTPRNEPRRTRESRHDRESQVGSGNQHQSLEGGGAP